MKTNIFIGHPKDTYAQHVDLIEVEEIIRTYNEKDRLHEIYFKYSEYVFDIWKFKDFSDREECLEEINKIFTFYKSL